MVCVLVFGALLLLADFLAYHDPAPILGELNGLSTKFEKRREELNVVITKTCSCKVSKPVPCKFVSA